MREIWRDTDKNIETGRRVDTYIVTDSDRDSERKDRESDR